MADLPPTYDQNFHTNVEDVRSMRYNQLGCTDMQVSCLSAGGVAFGGMYQSFSEQQGVEAVHLCLQKGINYFDTAPWYGQGKSEEFLGKALSGVPRHAFYMATKVGRYELEMSKMFNFRAEHILRGFEKSLLALKLDYVDVHDFEFAPSLDIIINETLPALQKLKDSGKARAIGINAYPLEELKQLVERSPVHIDTVFSYSRCGLFNNDLLDYVPYFSQKKVGIVNAAPVGLGLLSERGPEKWHPALKIKGYMDTVQKAFKIAAQNNVNLADLAVKYTTHASDALATTAISMPTPDLVRSNVKSALEPLTDRDRDIVRQVQKVFSDNLERTHWEPENVGDYKKFLEEQNRHE